MPIPPDFAAPPPERDIDVFGLLQRLWRRKLLALVFVALGLIGSVAYLHVAKYRYTAELMVTPADQSGPKLSGGLATLSSLAGVDPGSQGGANFALFGEAALSLPVAERLARDPRIMHTVFYKLWDARSRRWVEPSSGLVSFVKALKPISGVPDRPWQPPRAADLRTYLQDEVVLAEDKKKAVQRLVYHDADPAFARYLLQQIGNASDDFLRAKALNRATIYVSYLETRLREVAVAEYRMSLSQALISYENTRMMASSRASFAAEQFGEISVSPRPTSPQPVVVIALGAVGGLVLWAVVVLVGGSLRTMIRAHRAEAGRAADAALL